MERSTSEDAKTVRLAIENGDESQLAAIVAIVQKTGASRIAMDAAKVQAELAVAAALALPDSPCTQFLVHLARQSITRST
jgi:geranylgeranyl pyrophosphate synthase